MLGERLDGNNGVEVWSFRFKRRREGQCELRLYLMEGEESVELLPALLRRRVAQRGGENRRRGQDGDSQSLALRHAGKQGED